MIEALGDFKDKIDSVSYYGEKTDIALNATQYWPSPMFRDIITEFRTMYARCNIYNYYDKPLVNMFYYVMRQDTDWSIPFIHETMAMCQNNEQTNSLTRFTASLYCAYQIIKNSTGDTTYAEIVDTYCSSIDYYEKIGKDNFAKEILKNMIIQVKSLPQ